jgi:hypothetical protein
MRIRQHVFQAGPKGGRDLLFNGRKREKTVLKNLVRFAHKWNNGMLESWNDGFKETSIQNAFDFIDFLV